MRVFVQKMKIRVLTRASKVCKCNAMDDDSNHVWNKMYLLLNLQMIIVSEQM